VLLVPHFSQSNAKNSSRLLKFFKALTCGPAADVLKLDDMAELRRAITVKHNEMTNKQKNQKKKPNVPNTAASTAKPTLKQSSGGRNTNFASRLDDEAGDDDYEDFM
jgi:hypothetical protein